VVFIDFAVDFNGRTAFFTPQLGFTAVFIDKPPDFANGFSFSYYTGTDNHASGKLNILHGLSIQQTVNSQQGQFVLGPDLDSAHNFSAGQVGGWLFPFI